VYVNLATEKKYFKTSNTIFKELLTNKIFEEGILMESKSFGIAEKIEKQ
jgi:hypothetical protein